MASARTTPGLDEAAFQQMLEAAYVLQERSDSQPAIRPAPDRVDTLAEIAATQELLRAKDCDLHASARLIAERLQKITSATGVAVALIHEDQMEYCAAAGSVASLAGMATPIDASLSEFLQTAATDPSLIGELLKRHDSHSPFLFPVYHEGKVSGLLDVRFPECDGIEEREVQSCQVMAGLLGESIARAAKVEWKQALAAERATMLEVLERLRPQLERLAAEPSAASPVEPESLVAPIDHRSESTSPEIEALLTAMNQANQQDSSGSSCGQCGYQFGETELFCGRCGTPRAMASQTGRPDLAQPDLPRDFPQPDLPQEEVATTSAEFESAPHPVSEVPPTPTFDPLQFSTEVAFTEGNSALALRGAAEVERVEPATEEPQTAIAPVPPEPVSPANWTSATEALKWFQSLEKANSPSRIWLAKHRGDVSIALSALVLLLALTGWGLHPNSARAGNAPQLTLFERMLIGLGVAEAPPQPIASGNPNVWVWVDVHTALYHCPGTDLYGKTEGGKFALQHDAQLDQFQPAARKNCE
jgi:hypothetical protein